MIIKNFFFSIFILISSANALETIKHNTCDMYLNPHEHKYKWDKKFTEQLSTYLKAKGYNVKEAPKNKRIPPGSFHLSIDQTTFGKGYKECLVEMLIQQTKSNFISKNDTVIYKKSSSRKFPRHTFKGKERCFWALKDLKFDINFCEKN